MAYIDFIQRRDVDFPKALEFYVFFFFGSLKALIHRGFPGGFFFFSIFFLFYFFIKGCY